MLDQLQSRMTGLFSSGVASLSLQSRHWVGQALPGAGNLDRSHLMCYYAKSVFDLFTATTQQMEGIELWIC